MKSLILAAMAGVMVIAAPAGDLELSCGGAAMVPVGEEPPARTAVLVATARGSAISGKFYLGISPIGDIIRSSAHSVRP